MSRPRKHVKRICVTFRHHSNIHVVIFGWEFQCNELIIIGIITTPCSHIWNGQTWSQTQQKLEYLNATVKLLYSNANIFIKFMYILKYFWNVILNYFWIFGLALILDLSWDELDKVQIIIYFRKWLNKSKKNCLNIV